mmetsp:Transcript_14528/g.34161  ORF Transcript_14528/g.34161 Transcript_14528/m.34161 type:complete len:203 (+) Transcript_14528:516-1124(+)
MFQQLLGTWTIFFWQKALNNEFLHGAFTQSDQGFRILASGHFFVNLRRIFTLTVGVLVRNNFQNAHPKSVNVNGLGIAFLVEFGSHKLRRSYDTLCMRRLHCCREPQISNFDFPNVPVDEDVITLEVSVNDWARVFKMKVSQSRQNLATPVLRHTHADGFGFRNECLESSGSHELCDEDDLFFLRVLPMMVALDDIPVAKRL